MDTEDPLDEIENSFKKPCCFQEMPHEILIRIFSFLTVQELCQSVAPVCKNWLEVIKDNSLRGTLEFDLKTFNCLDENIAEGPQNILKRCPKLERIIIRRQSLRKLSWRKKVIPSYTCATLKIFEIHESIVLYDLLNTLAVNCPNLETLGFYNCNKNYNELPVEGICRVKKLRSLTLSNSDSTIVEVDDDFVRSLVGNCKKLEVLNIKDSPHITDSSVQYLAERRQDTLREIRLHAINLSDEGISSFSICTNLLVLDLHHAKNITNITFEAITHLNLQTLSISFDYWDDLELNERIKPEVLIRFFSAPSRRWLRRLSLHRFLSFDESVLSSVSLNCSNLEQLEIPFMGSVTDQGLLSSISSLSRLRYLNICGFRPSSDTTFQKMPKGLVYDTDHGKTSGIQRTD